MKNSFYYLFLFCIALMFSTCECKGFEETIDITFVNQSDDNIHIFADIEYTDVEGYTVPLLDEDFDASNKLEPGKSRKLRNIKLPDFYVKGGLEKSNLDYRISFYAGQGGFVFKSSVDRSIPSKINYYAIYWDGTDMEVDVNAD